MSEHEPPPRRSRLPQFFRHRPHHALETVLLASTACLLAAVAWPIATGGVTTWSDPPHVEVQDLAQAEAPTIQVALLLDTSGSMDGLLDQARAQLWSVVNALDGATFQDRPPRLEIAIYEYGNDGLSPFEGWIRQVTPFTPELDTVSAALFSLTTNGGSEHAGQAIAHAVDELQWKRGDNVLRVLYIAGNESFDQGPVAFRQSIERARGLGIVVNTVNCVSGQPDEGWAEAAALGGGKALRIDQNQQMRYIAAPQDEEIARLGQAINETYIHYGKEGAEGYANLIEQDRNSASLGRASSVTRSVSKSSQLYRNDSWDLVDALESRRIEAQDVDRVTLPEALQGLDDAELRAHVEGKLAERKELQARLGELSSEREAFLATARAQEDPDAAMLGAAIVESIREQAKAAGFTLEK